MLRATSAHRPRHRREKKRLEEIVENVEAHLASTLGERIVPWEYIEYLLCEKFGWTVSEVEAMPQNYFLLFLAFMQAERKAGRLKEAKSRFYEQ